MTDFSKILEKAKEVEAKMKESQEKIKQIEVIGVSGGDSVKITLNGEGIDLSTVQSMVSTGISTIDEDGNETYRQIEVISIEVSE